MYGPLARAQASPRSLVRAALLTLAMPGLGHVYCGRARHGLLVWLGVLAVALGGAIFWARWFFLPDVALILGGVALLALDAVLIADLARWVRASGATYQLRPVNHPLTYVGVGLGLGALPVFIAATVLAHGYVGSARVETYAMFPAFLPGDAVLFDRAAYADRPPVNGELVVVRQGQRLRVARVIATAGQTVRLFDGRPSIVGRPIARRPLVDLNVPRFTPADRARLAGLDGYWEVNGGRQYVVTYAKGLQARQTVSLTLGPDEVFVLGDNRDARRGPLSQGRVPAANILGRPQCIWASTDSAADVRPGRAGLGVR